MMIIRMNESHVSAVAELEKICFSDPWSENSVASELKNKLALWLVAEEEGCVAGYIGSQTCGDESDVMKLEVRASNVPAISLYEKLGFYEVGRRKNYYRNPREDALIMRKEWEI